MHDQIDRPPRVQMHEHERGQKKDTFANKLLHAVSSVCECVGNFHAPTICRYSTSPSFLSLSLLSISFRLFCTRRFSSSSRLSLSLSPRSRAHAGEKRVRKSLLLPPHTACVHTRITAVKPHARTHTHTLLPLPFGNEELLSSGGVGVSRLPLPERRRSALLHRVRLAQGGVGSSSAESRLKIVN